VPPKRRNVISQKTVMLKVTDVIPLHVRQILFDQVPYEITVSRNLLRAAVSSCHCDVNIERRVIKVSAKTAKSSKVKDRSIFWYKHLHGVPYQARADTLYVTIYVIVVVSVSYWWHPILQSTHSVRRIVGRDVWMTSSQYHGLLSQTALSSSSASYWTSKQRDITYRL
jgi:type IV secretory pathway VirB3-like protein